MYLGKGLNDEKLSMWNELCHIQLELEFFAITIDFFLQKIENPEAFTVSTFVDVVDENSCLSIDYCNSCNSYGQVQHCCAVCVSKKPILIDNPKMRVFFFEIDWTNQFKSLQNLNLCLDCMKIEGHMHATITLEKLEIAPSPVDAGRAHFSVTIHFSSDQLCSRTL